MVQRGRLGNKEWNWQWADEKSLALVIPGGAGLMNKVLADYETHGGKWARAFNFPYFSDEANGTRLNVGRIRAGGYSPRVFTPPRPWPTMYSVAGKVQIDPSGKPHPEAQWELQTGPLLVIDGKPTNVHSQVEAGGYTGLTPDAQKWRTGIGWKDGKVVHIISSGAVATLHDLQAAAMALGVQWFATGDGGGSVTLYQRGEKPESRANNSRPLPAVMVFTEVAGSETSPGLPITVDPIPLGRRNRPGHALTAKYITIHDTANANKGANAEMHAAYVKGDTAANLPVSWHFTVDDTSIYQHLPLSENAWHAGDGNNGAGNRQSIAIEICENSDGDRAKAEALAARLTAHLIETVPSLLPFPECVVQHNRWSGKNCPRVLRARPGGWQGFLDAVQRELGMPVPETRIDELQRQLTLAREEAAAARLKAQELEDTLSKIRALVN